MDDKYVCEKCITDPALQEVVRQEVSGEKCSYCHSHNAANLECVISRMREAIGTVYGDIEDNLTVNGEVPYTYQIDDILRDIDFNLANYELMQDIISQFGDRYCCIDREHDYLSGLPIRSWHDFTSLVKHRRRYTFSSITNPNDPDLDDLLWNPANVLDNIATTILNMGLIVPVKAGTEFWRVRVHEKMTELNTPDDFTTPPFDKAIYANRMSPAGIPMFYGADDFETAVLETVDPARTDSKCASGVAFRLLSDNLLLDLTAVPQMESFFCDWDQQKRVTVSFLDSFVRDLSRPVVKDGREHIDYVPSQVFTEFIRENITVSDTNSLLGIRYPSSKNHCACYVLFVEKEACLKSKDQHTATQMLEYVPNSQRMLNDLTHGLCKLCLKRGTAEHANHNDDG